MMRSRKLWVGFAALLFIVTAIFGTIRYRESRRQRTTEAQIAADFQQLRHDLPPGTRRGAVAEYLNQRKLTYYDDGHAYTANLGKTPGDKLVCADWNWDAKFSFEGDTADSPLKKIELSSSGRCL